MNERYIEKMRNHLNGDDIKTQYNVLKNEANHTDEEIKLIFPGIKTFSDLKFTDHFVVPEGVQSKMTFDNGGSISVVGGGVGLYGNGVTSFEAGYTDDSGEFVVIGWMSPEEVTELMLDIQSKQDNEG